MGTDQVFEQPAARGSFRFNDQVAQVFDNMASRSIPFYQENMRLSTELVRRFAQEGSAVYDLGCSTCTLLIQSAKELNGKEVKLVGYDPSESMRQQAQQKLDYYTYKGSLTTPPCSEGVRWLILSEVVEISAEQLRHFQEIYLGNARPVQELYQRNVKASI